MKVSLQLGGVAARHQCSHVHGRHVSALSNALVQHAEELVLGGWRRSREDKDKSHAVGERP